jgi:hypothetical protein
VDLLACALMKTAAKGDTTHELQNTANGTDVECKLLRRGFVSLRNVRLSVVPNKHTPTHSFMWGRGTPTRPPILKWLSWHVFALESFHGV